MPVHQLKSSISFYNDNNQNYTVLEDADALAFRYSHHFAVNLDVLVKIEDHVEKVREVLQQKWTSLGGQIVTYGLQEEAATEDRCVSMTNSVIESCVLKVGSNFTMSI